MSDYYDRDGTPMTLEQWAASFEPRQDKKRVAEDTVGDYWVSTVWLGLNHQYGDGPPLIFETMVFAQKDGAITDWGEQYADRYSTEAAALAGHEAIVSQLRAGVAIADLVPSPFNPPDSEGEAE